MYGYYTYLFRLSKRRFTLIFNPSGWVGEGYFLITDPIGNLEHGVNAK